MFLDIAPAEVDNLAREYCRQLGVDLEAKVQTSYGADLTPPERAADDYIKNNQIPLTASYLPTWRLMRPRAFEALAMHRALILCGHLPYQSDT